MHAPRGSYEASEPGRTATTDPGGMGYALGDGVLQVLGAGQVPQRTGDGVIAIASTIAVRVSSN